MKRGHFRLIAFLCLILFTCGNLMGCKEGLPSSPNVSSYESSENITSDSETEGGNPNDSSNDNPFAGGLVNGGNYEGN